MRKLCLFAVLLLTLLAEGRFAHLELNRSQEVLDLLEQAEKAEAASGSAAVGRGVLFRAYEFPASEAVKSELAKLPHYRITPYLRVTKTGGNKGIDQLMTFLSKMVDEMRYLFRGRTTLRYFVEVEIDAQRKAKGLPRVAVEDPLLTASANTSLAAVLEEKSRRAFTNNGAREFDDLLKEYQKSVENLVVELRKNKFTEAIPEVDWGDPAPSATAGKPTLGCEQVFLPDLSLAKLDKTLAFPFFEEGERYFFRWFFNEAEKSYRLVKGYATYGKETTAIYNGWYGILHECRDKGKATGTYTLTDEGKASRLFAYPPDCYAYFDHNGRPDCAKGERVLSQNLADRGYLCEPLGRAECLDISNEVALERVDPTRISDQLLPFPHARDYPLWRLELFKSDFSAGKGVREMPMTKKKYIQHQNGALTATYFDDWHGAGDLFWEFEEGPRKTTLCERLDMSLKTYFFTQDRGATWHQCTIEGGVLPGVELSDLMASWVSKTAIIALGVGTIGIGGEIAAIMLESLWESREDPSRLTQTFVENSIAEGLTHLGVQAVVAVTPRGIRWLRQMAADLRGKDRNAIIAQKRAATAKANSLSGQNPKTNEEMMSLTLRKLGDEAGRFSDELLEAWAKFDDNVLDVASVGKQNWKTFQNRVAEQLQSLHPGKKIGNQITLDVTYVENGITKTKTIIPDNLIQVEVNGIKKYKVIDAKTAQTDLVNKADLTSTCTQNQQPIYKMIDGDASAGTITKVEMRGGQATNAFDNVTFNNGKLDIQLESGVEFWVNTNPTDFTQYLIRPRIK